MRAMHVSATTISAVVLLAAMHLPLITALHTATHKADSSTISRAASHAAPRAGVVHAHAVAHAVTVTSNRAGTSTHDERTPVTPSANRKSGVSPFDPTPAGCDAHIASATCMLLAKLKRSTPPHAKWLRSTLSALLSHSCLLTNHPRVPILFRPPFKKRRSRITHGNRVTATHTQHMHTIRVFRTCIHNYTT
jgi:hypothetical protein